MTPGPRNAARIPGLFVVAFLLLAVTNFVDFPLFGFNFKGWAWVLILALSLVRIALHPEKIAFPCGIWALWAGYVFLHGFSGYEYAWQSTAQILCPLLAGAAASTYRLRPQELQQVHRIIRYSYAGYVAGFLLIVVPYAVAHANESPFAAGAITSLVFQAYFLAAYTMNGRRTMDLICYLSALAVPVLLANRGPLLASIALLVFAAVPIALSRRVLIAGMAAVIGIGAFYSPKVQRKMFYSGAGELSDLRLDNPDLNTNGRRAMWQSLESGMSESPWIGHGGNADRTWLLSAGFPTYAPHNDWLRVRFNYGWLGVALYAAAMAMQVRAVRRSFRQGRSPFRDLAAAGASSFVPYALVMFTDNILIYCQYFTVPAMMILGASYSKLPSAAWASCARRPQAHCAGAAAATVRCAG